MKNSNIGSLVQSKVNETIINEIEPKYKEISNKLENEVKELNEKLQQSNQNAQKSQQDYLNFKTLYDNSK